MGSGKFTVLEKSMDVYVCSCCYDTYLLLPDLMSMSSSPTPIRKSYLFDGISTPNSTMPSVIGFVTVATNMAPQLVAPDAVAGSISWPCGTPPWCAARTVWPLPSWMCFLGSTKSNSAPRTRRHQGTLWTASRPMLDSSRVAPRCTNPMRAGQKKLTSANPSPNCHQLASRIFNRCKPILAYQLSSSRWAQIAAKPCVAL